MVDPIGLSLAAIALLDPAYNRIKAIWDGCQAIKRFGIDFNIYTTRLRMQERDYEISLRRYEAYVCGDHSGTRWIDAEVREEIEHHTSNLATVIRECYALAERYKIGNTPNQDEETRGGNGPVAEQVTDAQTTGQSVASRLRRFVRRKRSRHGKAPAHEITPGLAETRAIRRQEEAQRTLGPVNAIRFGTGDQELMERLLARLDQMNQELHRALPRLDYENPLFHIRNGASPPTLWQDTEIIREDIYSLQEALTLANSEDADSAVKLAVRLEDNHNEVLDWVKGNHLDRRLRKRSRPSFFLLMALSQMEVSDHAPCHELLTAGTLSHSRSQLEVADGDMPSKLHDALSETPQGNFQDVGDLKLDGTRVFNLRRIVENNGRKWKGGQNLSDIVEKPCDEFSVVSRIRLAARLALSHIHFATSNPGSTQRQLKHYRFFTQNAEIGTEDYHHPWLDHGFGSPDPTEPAGGLKSQEEIAQRKVNPAKELGVLLYQITSRHSIAYEETPDGLDTASRSVLTPEFLDQIRDLCGLPTRDIVRACFCHIAARSGKQDPSFVIIETVADALQRLVNEYTSRADQETAIEARLSGETVTIKPAEERAVETQQPEQGNLIGQEPPMKSATTPQSSTAQQTAFQREASTPSPRQQSPEPVRSSEVLPQSVPDRVRTPQLLDTPELPPSVGLPQQAQQMARIPGPRRPQTASTDNLEPTMFPAVPANTPPELETNGSLVQPKKIALKS